MLSQRNLLLLYALSGVLLGIGFVIPVLWWLGFFGVATLVFAFSKTHLLKTMVLGGFISWLIKSLFATSLFWSVYPIKWIELDLGKSEPFIIGIYWLTVSAFLAGGGSFLASVWWKIRGNFKIGFEFVLFPIIWVVSEVVSALLFSVWTYGPGGTLNAVYSLGYTGYLLGNHSLLIWFAKLGGVYALSLLAVLVGFLIFYFYKKLPQRKFLSSVTIFLLLVWGSQIDTGWLEEIKTEGTDKITVAVIDTKFGDNFFGRSDRINYKKQQVTQAVDAALSINPDYIILPEDSEFTDAEMTPEKAYRFYRFWSSDNSAILIDSGRTILPDGTAALRAVVYDGVSKKGWATDKQYLVPQGEYFPYLYNFSLRALGYKESVEKINTWLDYRPGPLNDQLSFPSVVPAILFCFESADPRGVRRLVNEREVPFVAHPMSHAWFHESQLLWQQQDLMLKIQALWNGVNIVSAGNQVSGALYTKTGRKIQTTPVLTGEAWQVGLVSW